jgi:hypothetical protein
VRVRVKVYAHHGRHEVTVPGNKTFTFKGS